MSLLVHAVDVLHYTIGITKPKPHQYGLFLLLWCGGTLLIVGGVVIANSVALATLERRREMRDRHGPP